MQNSGGPTPSFLRKLGILAMGVAALAFFAAWPMYQVAHGERQVTVSLAGIALGAMLTVVGLNLLLLGDRGIPWKKTKDQPLTPFQRLIVAATVIAGLALVAFVYYFLQQHGYRFGSGWER